MKKYDRAAGLFYFDDGNSLISVWAPLAQSMSLILLDPEEQELDLSMNRYGYWQRTLPAVQPGTRYYLKPDNDKPLPDPASRFQPEGVHGPSAVYNSQAYQWKTDSWKGISLREMIIYELHTGAFSKEESFAGIINKLDYLQQLGVNCIELLPVAQFPGKRNWGYDGVFQYAVQNSYGGPDQLKALVDAAHQKNIAVILDVVYNHQGPEGNYLPAFGPYNTDKYHTPWAKAMNFDDAHCDGVREFYLQNAMTWLEEFRIDGLRLDAVHAIWDNSATHFLEELNHRVRELERRTGKKKVLIAEFDLNNPRYINPVEVGGYGLDGQWIDEFHHALHALITSETSGYYADFGKIGDFEKAIRDSYVFTGQYSQHRKKNFGRKTENSFDQFIVFAQNHDHTGNRLKGERLSTIMQQFIEKQNYAPGLTSSLVNESLKLIAAAYLLSPYVPMLFMGEEYGEDNPFLFFTDHSDEELIANTSKGRKKEFESFNWQEDPPEPNDPETFKTSKLSWEKINQPVHAALFHYYRQLIHLRKSHPAFQSVRREDLDVFPSSEHIVSFKRKNNNHEALIILNFSAESLIYENDGLRGKKIFDSSRNDWADSSNSLKEHIENVITVPPYSATIIEL